MSSAPKPQITESEGLRRSAQLMRALGASAANVWAELSPQDASLLSQTLDTLPDDPALEDEAARTLLAAPVTPGHKQPIWNQLSALPPEQLAGLLSGEHPQVIAMSLARIQSAPAARVVRHMPSLLAMDVLQRMLHMGTPHDAALQAVEASFSAKLEALGPHVATSGEATLARIFDELDEEAGKTLLSALETSEPDASARIKTLMFSFEDLATLSPAGMQTLLSRADRQTLALALKGASGPVADTIFRNMTARARDMLQDEIMSLGAVPRQEVDAARADLTRLTRTLLANGEIRSGASDAEDLVE